MSRISQFFANKNVLITGATGSLGMSLVEKLLRAFPDIGRINLLVRKTGAETVPERAAKYFDNEAFSRLKETNPEAMEKIVCLEGDIGEPDLGLSPESIRAINETVNLIYHSAATVNFLEPMKNAIRLNVCATKELLQIAKNCKNLNSFMHVSTSFVNHRLTESSIEEKIYKHTIEPETLVTMSKALSHEQFEGKRKELLRNWPFTYIFSKNAAENLLHEDKNDLKIGIFRPGSISEAYREPFPYWMLNQHAFSEFLRIIHTGLVCKSVPNCPGNCTPVDLCTNALIAATYDTAKHSEGARRIYNFAVNLPSWHQMTEMYLKNVDDPWLAFGSLRYRFISHMKDLALEMSGRKGIFVKEIARHEKFVQVLEYFALKQFSYCTKNVDALWDSMSPEDKELLFFNLKDVNWNEYFGGMCKASDGRRLNMLDATSTIVALSQR